MAQTYYIKAGLLEGLNTHDKKHRHALKTDNMNTRGIHPDQIVFII